MLHFPCHLTTKYDSDRTESRSRIPLRKIFPKKPLALRHSNQSRSTAKHSPSWLPTMLKCPKVSWEQLSDCLPRCFFFYQNSRKPFESIFLSWWGAKSKKTSDEKETQYFAQGHIRLRENPHHYEFHFLLLFNLQHSPLSWARNLKMLAVWKCQNLKTRLFFWHYATLVLGCYHNGTARKGVIMINLILRDCRAVFGCNLEGFLRAFTFDESNSKTLFLCVVAVQSRLLMEHLMNYWGFYLLLFFYVWRLRLF